MPKDAEPHYQMGLAYLEVTDLADAVRAFNKAIALNPKHAGAQLKMAELMVTTQDEKLLQQAMSRIRDAFGASPADPESIETLALAEWKLGKPAEAAERLENALARFPTRLQSSQILARMKLSKNDWTGAEEVLKKAVADSPKSSPAALALGEFYKLFHQFGKAELILTKAVQLDPANGSALVALAGIQAANGKMNEAEHAYRQASALPDKAYKPLHAMFLYQSGKREEAVAELSRLSHADPNDRDLRGALVTAYIGMGQISKAQEVVAAALKRNSKDTAALLQRAELRLRSGMADDAANDFQKVLHFDPTSVKAHLGLADANRVKGLSRLQHQELERALELGPGLLRVRLQLAANLLGAKQARAAFDVLSRAPDYQKSDLRWIVVRNWVLLYQGKFAEAKASIEQILKQGRAPAVVFQSAAFRTLERDYSGALANVDELLKLHPTDVNTLDLMMQIYEAQHNVSKGIERISQLATAHRDSAPLQNLLGQWYRRTGNAGAARSAFEATKSVDPHFISADLSLAEMDIREGRNAAARQRLDGIVEAYPTDTTALLLSARADEQAGDSAAAIRRYRAVIAIDSSNLIALNNLAFLMAPNDPDEALKYAQQAAELAPAEATIQDTLGWIFYRKGLATVAVQHLKAAVDNEPTPRRQFHLGMTYLKTGNREAGRNMVNEALAKDPTLAKTELGWRDKDFDRLR